MENKTCQTCIYYIQYFRKGRYCFSAVGCGYCIKTRQDEIINETDKGCRKYKEKEKEKAEQLRSAEKLLSRISKSLEDLKELLKS